MIHEVFNIEGWKATFPLEPLRQYARDTLRARPDHWRLRDEPFRADGDYVTAVLGGLSPVTSPYHLAVLEQQREEAFRTFDPGRQVPTDVFVFGRGEPPRREVTKTGGLPYWPARRPWPHRPDGKPMTFVFQFCFADSRDITGDLPGDVLLYFAETDVKWDVLHNWFTFEWLKLGETELVTAADVPNTPWNILPVFGVIHRTYDYPDLYRIQQEEEDVVTPDCIAAIEGTKIGGQPHWVQWPHEDTVLCVCCTVDPVLHLPAPYVNIREPLRRREQDALQWGDSGTYYVHLEADGQVWDRWDCY